MRTKNKAKKNHLEGQLIYEHVTMEEAWEELSVTAFALWTRMQNLDIPLDSGQVYMSKYFGMSRPLFFRTLQELERTGYIDLAKKEDGYRKTKIILRRHCVIYGDNTFVKLTEVKELEFKDYLARLNHVEGPGYEC